MEFMNIIVLMLPHLRAANCLNTTTGAVATPAMQDFTLFGDESSYSETTKVPATPVWTNDTTGIGTEDEIGMVDGLLHKALNYTSDALQSRTDKENGKTEVNEPSNNSELNDVTKCNVAKNSGVDAQRDTTDETIDEYQNDAIELRDVIEKKESKVEKVLFFLYLIIVSVYIYLGNGMVIFLGAKHRQFHHPGFYTKCAYATLDILLNSVSNLSFMVTLYLQGRVPLLWCQLYSTLTIAFFFSTMYMTAYIALER